MYLVPVHSDEVQYRPCKVHHTLWAERPLLLHGISEGGDGSPANDYALSKNGQCGFRQQQFLTACTKAYSWTQAEYETGWQV